MVALAERRGATPTFDPGTYEMGFSYDLEVSDGATSCTQTREAHYVDGAGAQARMQHAVDAGLGGVALFALGYEDDATWHGIATITAQLTPPTTPTTTPG